MAFVATALPVSAAIPPDPTGLTGTPGNFWVNHTWDADTTGVTDSYNLSVNGAPHSTTNEYWNGSYSAHAWQNITVHAFNDTDGLSTGSVSQKTQILNNPITITGISGATVDVDATVHVDCEASDADGDTPKFSCNRTDLFAFNTATGVGDWTPSTSGTYYVDFGVSDGYGSTNNVTMKITVSDAATTTPPKPTNLDSTTGNYWVNYTWLAGSDGVVTDSYNVSLNDAWYNGTATFLNKEVGPSGWANITVWAYNTSGDGNLSAGSVSDEVQAPEEPSGHSTGFRIWDENRKPPMDLNYTWTARSYTGFYYDIDDDISTERLTIQLDPDNIRNIEEGNLKYVTTAADLKFEYNDEDWGSYKVIGFMAEKYFAGYEAENTSITNEDIRLLSKDMLSKVLIDEDEKHTISTGASLELKEGYELKIIQLDIDGGQAQIDLMKDGKSVDTDIVTSPDDYVYTEDIGKLDDVPLVVVHIDSVFAGTESDMLVINGIFQISDDLIPVDTGEDYGEMEIQSASGYTITMENSDDIDLEQDEIVDIMGNLKFLVADNDTLRFALYEEITEPGTHDIRGTVYDTGKATWDHMNFEGFYYNIDDDLGTETLVVEDCSGNTIPEDGLVYETTAQLVEFDLSEWGSFKVVGFMAESYFAGYDEDETDDDITNDNINLLSKDMLSKVLIDVEDDRMISTGASLQLEEGYELKIIQLDIDGGQAQIELLKNGRSVDTEIVQSPDTYVYTEDLGKLDDVPLVVVYIDNVFAGTESDLVTIKGVFQISDDPISVDSGDEYGEMEITSASGDKITMKNKENEIDLDEGESVMIMENIGFTTSDDGGDRYYLFVRRTIGSIAALKIELPESLVVGEEIVITITADGDPVEGAQVQFAGENLGLTDSDGKVTITSEEAGTFTIIASKENYDSASEEIRILTESEAEKDPLKIEMPDKVEPEEDVVIMVSYKGDAIENASVSWDGDYIGDTDETGSLTYTAEDEGTYTVTASKEGYLDGSGEIEVAYPSAEFELADLTFPENVSANKEFTVSVDVTNTGDANGTYIAELKVNGSVVDSQNVTLDAGDTGKIEFTTRIAEAGTTTIEIGTESGEITVTKTKSNTALIAAVLIVLALLGAIGYLLISSAPEGGWTVEKLSDAIKDKFQRGGKGL